MDSVAWNIASQLNPQQFKKSKFVEAALMLTFNMFENGMGREAGYE
jgi:hypothetical protein